MTTWQFPSAVLLPNQLTENIVELSLSHPIKGHTFQKKPTIGALLMDK